MTEIAYRWSGVFLIAGAALLGVGTVTVAFKPVINQPFSPGIARLMLLASILLLISIPAMYAKQASAAGWLGLAGYLLLQTGIVLLALLAATPILYPSLNQGSGENLVLFLLGISLTLGLLLTGIATLQAGVFPRWAGILVLVATAGFFFNFFVAEFLPPMAGQVGSAFFGVILAIALAWMGVFLWIDKAGH